MIPILITICVLAVFATAYGVYKHNRAIDRCTERHYNGSDSHEPATKENIIPNPQADLRPVMAKLSHYTSTQVTRVAQWRYNDVKGDEVHIEFTFMWNNYVRQYARVVVPLTTEDKYECEAKCVTAIMNKKLRTSPNWDY